MDDSFSQKTMINVHQKWCQHLNLCICQLLYILELSAQYFIGMDLEPFSLHRRSLGYRSLTLTKSSEDFSEDEAGISPDIHVHFADIVLQFSDAKLFRYSEHQCTARMSKLKGFQIWPAKANHVSSSFWKIGTKMFKVLNNFRSCMSSFYLFLGILNKLLFLISEVVIH